MVAERSGNDPVELASAKTALQHLARDHARIPFSWDSSPNAGFSKGQPWMRANDDSAICNARQQQTDKSSVLSFWKYMLQLREQYVDLFVHGNFDILDKENTKIFHFTKTWQNRKAYVALNFTDKTQALYMPPEIQNRKVELLTSSFEGHEESKMAPYEGRVYLL